MNEINAAIAERILGWEPIDREKGLYQKPGGSGPGPVGPCPDFFFLPGNQLLREAMSNLGFTLELTTNPVNWEKETGKTFTACFTRGNEAFEETENDENVAVCWPRYKLLDGYLHLARLRKTFARPVTAARFCRK